MVEVDIQNRVKNPVLKREELEVTVSHEGGTPKRDQIQQEISKALMVKKEMIVLNRIIPRFGSKQLKVRVHVYENAEAMKIEMKKGKKKEEPKKG